MPTDERVAPLTEPAVPEAALDAPAALALLRMGMLSVEGRLVDASNATLYCTVSADGVTAACVYKPVRGERPLWDFPEGTLAGREYASYLVSDAVGLDVVPPTVLRDGPFGVGMVQWWVDVDASVDLVALLRSDDPALRSMALFDAVANNADRKGGHLLPVATGHVYGCDHGLTFHQQPKLRTVLWGWRGEPFSPSEHELLDELAAGLCDDGPLRGVLTAHLTPAELHAIRRRVRSLRRAGCFPEPSPDWPAVPWPPF